MPKSKRARNAHVGRATSRGRQRKGALVGEVQNAADEHKVAYVFAIANARGNALKEVRAELADDSRFFFGKNKVMRLALGRSEEESYKPNLWRLGEELRGNVGVLFTNRPFKEVEEYFSTFRRVEFARAGFVATRQVVAPAGAIRDQPSSMLEQMRRDMALPVVLRRV